MPRPSIRIHNVETDEIFDREMNDVEFEIHQKEQQIRAEEEATLAKKAADKIALLEKLGITEEEAKLLLS
jgi:hypothetical protein